jgi:flavin reductase (DIM6/NTAB) family NADH-FMN oxidoreductase RutF
MTGVPAKREFEPIARVMHELPYGIYAIGTTDGSEVNVMVADWVMQVSFHPRMVAVAFEHDSSSLARVRKHPYLTINLLAADPDSMRMAMQFVQPAEAAKIRGRSEAAAARHHDKLAGIDYTLTEHGLPLLSEALAWLEVEAEQFVEAGDHTLAIARVLDGDVLRSGEPMTSLYTGWVYSG